MGHGLSPPLDPARLEAALAAHAPREHPPLPGRTNHLRAGVLLPLIWEPTPVLLLELRPARLSLHGGEVCFPGGRPEPDDPDLCATALREAREELGLRDARPLGRLSSTPLFTSDYRLEPFVAEAPPQPLAPNPGEVARVLRLDLAALLAREAIDAIPYRWEDGVERLSPVFEADGALAFGATAHVLWELVEVAARAVEREAPRLEPGRYGWEDVLERRDAASLD